MGAETIVTLIIVGVIVGAIAAYLIIIARTLYKVTYNLDTILIGIRSIEKQTEPVARYVGIILNDVLAIDQAAGQLLSWGKGAQGDGARRRGRPRKTDAFTTTTRRS